jgi:hypothetical protein
MKIKKYLFSFVSLFLALPFVALGVATPSGGYQNWVANIMAKVETAVWQFFFGITVIMFIVAGILFVTANGDPGKIKTAKTAVIWGVVGIIVATISFGIVGLVSGWVD